MIIPVRIRYKHLADRDREAGGRFNCLAEDRWTRGGEGERLTDTATGRYNIEQADDQLPMKKHVNCRKEKSEN